jgi:hypothetical protein
MIQSVCESKPMGFGSTAPRSYSCEYILMGTHECPMRKDSSHELCKPVGRLREFRRQKTRGDVPTRVHCQVQLRQPLTIHCPLFYSSSCSICVSLSPSPSLSMSTTALLPMLSPFAFLLGLREAENLSNRCRSSCVSSTSCQAVFQRDELEERARPAG